MSWPCSGFGLSAPLGKGSQSRDLKPLLRKKTDRQVYPEYLPREARNAQAQLLRGTSLLFDSRTGHPRSLA